MKAQSKLAFVIALALAGTAQVATSATVNSTYISTTKSQISAGVGYTNPTIYMDRYACGEQQLSAFACSPTVISVGSSFLQSVENQFGNYGAKAVLAHEWGHTIQFSRGINLQQPYQELQADCAGGSFVRYANDSLGYTTLLNSAVAAARNYAGGDHGTPAQRDYYTRWGYTNRVAKCLSSMPRV
ncbi:hypothetical protein KSF73_07300 [Burkholderiaceae bacterium DAT-1]|nr:hypothetical protein [Burkholderiaceae bacterium DAT-1]